MDLIHQYVGDIRDVLMLLPFHSIDDVIDLLLSVNYVGGHVFTLGNGGSAATASHFACDLAKGTIVPGRSRFRVIALTDAIPVMTPIILLICCALLTMSRIPETLSLTALFASAA